LHECAQHRECAAGILDCACIDVCIPLCIGVPDAVSDVRVEFINPNINISWSAPFTLPVASSLGISYCISVTNTIPTECGIRATTYSVELELSPCIEYSAIITPSNEVGNGTSTTKIFPEGNLRHACGDGYKTCQLRHQIF
jgi:hypothetical protein